MIVVKNARFITDNKTVKCTMDYYVLLNGAPEKSPRVAVGEAHCAPEDKFNFKDGMDLAYDRAYAKAVEVAKKMNRPKMHFVCVKSGNDFTSGTIYPVQYDEQKMWERLERMYKFLVMSFGTGKVEYDFSEIFPEASL